MRSELRSRQVQVHVGRRSTAAAKDDFLSGTGCQASSAGQPRLTQLCDEADAWLDEYSGVQRVDPLDVARLRGNRTPSGPVFMLSQVVSGQGFEP